MDFEELKSGVTTIGLLVIVLAAFVLANSAFKADIISSISASTSANESLTLSSSSNSYVANNYVLSITEILVNTTGGAVTTFSRINSTTDYNSTNVNTEEALGIIASATYANNESLITYTYTDDASSTAANITTFGTQGISNTTSYFPTIGTLMGVAALLIIVIGAFLWIKR